MSTVAVDKDKETPSDNQGRPPRPRSSLHSSVDDTQSRVSKTASDASQLPLPQSLLSDTRDRESITTGDIPPA